MKSASTRVLTPINAIFDSKGGQNSGSELDIEKLMKLDDDSIQRVLKRLSLRKEDEDNEDLNDDLDML
jgi:hypothetical protein